MNPYAPVLDKLTDSPVSFRIAPIDGCDTQPAKVMTEAQAKRIVEIADHEYSEWHWRTKADIEVTGIEDDGMVWLSIDSNVPIEEIIYIFPDGSFSPESAGWNYKPTQDWSEYVDDACVAQAERAYEQRYGI